MVRSLQLQVHQQPGLELQQQILLHLHVQLPSEGRQQVYCIEVQLQGGVWILAKSWFVATHPKKIVCMTLLLVPLLWICMKFVFLLIVRYPIRPPSPRGKQETKTEDLNKEKKKTAYVPPHLRNVCCVDPFTKL